MPVIFFRLPSSFSFPCRKPFSQPLPLLGRAASRAFQKVSSQPRPGLQSSL